jgi:dihydrolipoamide dehydrogenase
VFQDVAAGASFGITVDGAVSPNLPTLVERSRSVAADLNTGVGFLLKKNGVKVIWGEAKLTGPVAMEVTEPKCNSNGRIPAAATAGLRSPPSA